MLLKAHPHLNICVIDIPPQLYVTEQYLSACFKGQVCGYRALRGMNKIGRDIFDKYSIVALAPWQLDYIDGVSFDLFWNSASFQEMEPPVVENYAKYIQKMVSKWLYLRNQPDGSSIVEGRKKNVEAQTRMEHYVKFFSDFELVDRSPSKVIPNIASGERYDNMIFRRKAPKGGERET
ncbi:MAG: putative sugar O-methyltransferase [Candidatus Omnitrophica bacterium]|nr:putative sugar O-methyltransferase [Candidatus Omnitrophota bacterium]